MVEIGDKGQDFTLPAQCHRTNPGLNTFTLGQSLTLAGVTCPTDYEPLGP